MLSVCHVFVVVQSGLTPLHVAAFIGSENIVSYLLEKGADVNSLTQRGETPLHYAARAAQPNVIKLLLDHGADVNAKSKASLLLINSPFHDHAYNSSQSFHPRSTLRYS